MAGLFAKAKAGAAVAAPKATKKATVWLVGDKPETAKLGVAVKELVQLAQQAKAVEAKTGVFKAALKDHGEHEYVDDYVRVGVEPETPMVIQNTDGDKVTFVVQDRSSQYGVKPDQKAALAELLGEDRAAEMLYEETTFGFNRDVMALPGVQEIVEKALESAVRKLVSEKVLTEEQVELLLDVKTKEALKPGTLGRLVLLCGRDTVKVGQLLEILGSSATRYIKV